MAKHDRLYRLTSRHAWRVRSCIQCKCDLNEGDIIFSKARNSATRYYCGSCAEQLGIITKTELENVKLV